MIVRGIFSFDESLYSSPLIATKYVKGNRCILGYKTSTLKINGVPFKDSVGIDINVDAKHIEVAAKSGTVAKIPYAKLGTGEIEITKEGNAICVNVK